jgi:hypothetical protein
MLHNKSKDNQFPIEFHSALVQIQVVHQSVLVAVEQTFLNTSPAPIEAAFSFPLPPDATVTSFEAIVAGKVCSLLSS